MADQKFTQLPVAGALAAADLLAIAQSPFGAGSSKSITGTVLASFITSTVTPALGAYLPLAGGTLVGNLIFSLDNTLDIGASLATRPRTGYFGTSVVAPLFTGALTGAASANVLKAGDTMTGNLIFSLDNTLDIGAAAATRPRRVYVGTEVVAPLFTGAVTGGSSLNVLKAGDTMTGLLAISQGTVNTAMFTMSGASLTGSNATNFCTIAGTWNTSGSSAALLVNILNTSSPLSARLLDLQVGGTSKFKVTKDGAVTTSADLLCSGSVTALASLSLGGSGTFAFTGRTNMVSPVDGILTIFNTAGSDFTRLNFGGSTSSFPAISRSTTNLVLVLADGTGNAGLTTGPLTTVSSQTHKYLAINGATVLDATHYCVNATANTFDVTLPTAVSVAGRTYVIKNSGTGVVTLKANGAETIDGVASWIINQYTSLTVMSDGAGWILI